MTKQYQLIHIDTKEVTMCEKITEYYVSNEEIKEGDWCLSKLNEIVIFGKNYQQNLYRKIRATTNTSLQCPQVVDYVEELAKLDFFYESGEETYVTDRCRNAFIDGYQKHSETHSLNDDDVVEFAKFSLKHILYQDDNNNLQKRSFEDLLTLFKSTLPTKVYYR